MAGALVFMATAATVLAGVLNIDGKPTEVFKQNFGGQAAVAAGAGGGNKHLTRRVGPVCQPVRHVAPQVVAVQIHSQGASRAAGCS